MFTGGRFRSGGKKTGLKIQWYHMVEKGRNIRLIKHPAGILQHARLVGQRQYFFHPGNMTQYRIKTGVCDIYLIGFSRKIQPGKDFAHPARVCIQIGFEPVGKSMQYIFVMPGEEFIARCAGHKEFFLLSFLFFSVHMGQGSFRDLIVVAAAQAFITCHYDITYIFHIPFSDEGMISGFPAIFQIFCVPFHFLIQGTDAFQPVFCLLKLCRGNHLQCPYNLPGGFYVGRSLLYFTNGRHCLPPGPESAAF